MRAWIAAWLAAITPSLSAQSQPTWAALPALPYSGGQQHVGCFDSLRGLLRVHQPGGTHAVFNGVAWQSQPAVVGASPVAPLGGCRMAYDPVRDRTVVVGPASLLGWAVWEHDGTTWTQSNVAPPFANCHGLVFHTQRARVVAYSSTGLSEWNGIAWQALPAGGSPPPASTSGSAYDVLYDAQRNRLAVCSRALASSGSLWEWSLATGWQVVQATSLGENVRAGFDPVRNRYLCVARPTLAATDFVWEFAAGSGNPWQLVGQTLWPTGDGALVFDSTSSRTLMLVLPQTLSGMLAYAPGTPGLYYTHGSGCAGGTFTAPVLMQEPWYNELPTIGDSFTVRVATPGQFAVVATGLSDQHAFGAPLPLSLSPIGMLGCSLRVSPDLLQATFTGVSTLTFPPTASLAGIEFFQQALALLPANAFGGLLSNSMRGVLGTP